METGQASGGPTVDELVREIAELRASRARLASGSDADRRRIERTLHEGVQQDLVGLAANLEVVSRSLDSDPGGARAILDEVRREVHRALTEVQDLAAQIFPSLLEADGMVPELRGAAGRAGVPVLLAVDADGAVPPTLAGALYFCAVGMFDRAPPGTPFEIRVRREGEALAFEIVARCELGTQRSDPHDRIEALDGHVTITSGDGQTTVAGSMPLPR